MESLVITGRRRLEDARKIADCVRHNKALHQLAMKTVFVLEDVHESFVRMQQELDERDDSKQAKL